MIAESYFLYFKIFSYLLVFVSKVFQFQILKQARAISWVKLH